MIFRQLNAGSCRTYLIASESAREAILIDPLLESVEDYLRLLQKEKFKLRCVIDTHTHADHLSGAAAIQKTAQVDYVMHAASAAKCVSRRIQDGEEMGFGDVRLKFVHTPGHTRDSLMIVLPDRFLSGDFLFIGKGGAGRLDLPGGDAAAHFDSLRKLDALPDGTLMFPAHDYRGNAQSTLREERSSNPVLEPRSRDQYLQWWSGLKLAPADWMKSVITANAACTCDPTAVKIPKSGYACEACAPAAKAGTAVPEWTAHELSERLKQGGDFAIIDVREPEEYTGELGHIRGSRLVPLGQIGERLADIPKGPVVTVCRSGGRSMRAAQQLVNAGWTDVHSLKGGMLGWNDARLPVETHAHRKD